MLFENILVPYDLSKCSNHAFKVALNMAEKYDSKLNVLTCIERDDWHHYYFDSRADAQLLKKQRKATEKHTSKLEEAAKKKGIKISTNIVKTESAVKQIVSFVKSRKIDLVVMGSHGRTGFDKLVLGSVANGVAQKVNCPVLIIK
jgi:nucleotide-binding universal stress UspA family protein